MPKRPMCLAGFVLIVVLVLTPQPAQAYIDPGTGSLILQVVAATFLGVLLVAKSFFSQIAAFLAVAVAAVAGIFKGRKTMHQPPPLPPRERGK